MAELVQFGGDNLRSVVRVDLTDVQQLNVLVGPNGAGKTSVLEGIHVLGSGRSFRSRQLAHVVRREAEFLRVTGRVRSAGGGEVHVGIERGPGGLEIRSGDKEIRRSSDLARLLPLLVVRPESYEVFSGPSEERRRTLDWTVFHVEPDFGSVFARYTRALRQRNALLRGGGVSRQVVAPWDAELAESGSHLDALRRSVLERCGERVGNGIQCLTGVHVTMTYRRGWADDAELSDALEGGFESDRERGTTQRGPHRADLKFSVEGRDARQVLSRGEGKRLVLAFLLGVAKEVGLQRNNNPVFLLDDLASELDSDAREQFLSLVAESGFQTFITAVDQSLIAPDFLSNSALFHVKQGVIARVL